MTSKKQPTDNDLDLGDLSESEFSYVMKNLLLVPKENIKKPKPKKKKKKAKKSD